MDEHEYIPSGDMMEIRCAHHWLIEPPQGPTSIGTCKICGETSEFENQYSPAHAQSTRNKQEHDTGDLVAGRQRR